MFCENPPSHQLNHSSFCTASKYCRPQAYQEVPSYKWKCENISHICENYWLKFRNSIAVCSFSFYQLWSPCKACSSIRKDAVCLLTLPLTGTGARTSVWETYTPKLKDSKWRTNILTCSYVPENNLKAECTRTSMVSYRERYFLFVCAKRRCSLLWMLRHSWLFSNTLFHSCHSKQLEPPLCQALKFLAAALSQSLAAAILE